MGSIPYQCPEPRMRRAARCQPRTILFCVARSDPLAGARSRPRAACRRRTYSPGRLCRPGTRGRRTPRRPTSLAGEPQFASPGGLAGQRARAALLQDQQPRRHVPRTIRCAAHDADRRSDARARRWRRSADHHGKRATLVNYETHPYGNRVVCSHIRLWAAVPTNAANAECDQRLHAQYGQSQLARLGKTYWPRYQADHRQHADDGHSASGFDADERHPAGEPPADQHHWPVDRWRAGTRAKTRRNRGDGGRGILARRVDGRDLQPRAAQGSRYLLAERVLTRKPTFTRS